MDLARELLSPSGFVESNVADVGDAPFNWYWLTNSFSAIVTVPG